MDLPRTRLWIAVLSCTLGCGEPTGPGIQPEITNRTDEFEYQVSEVQSYTGTLQYNWQMTGTQANVNQATVVTSGSLELVILDAAASEVYRRDLRDNGTFQTAAGQPGAWTIRVVYAGASGTVNFRVQKRP
jgi:hypothetical protein